MVTISERAGFYCARAAPAAAVAGGGGESGAAEGGSGGGGGRTMSRSRNKGLLDLLTVDVTHWRRVVA